MLLLQASVFLQALHSRNTASEGFDHMCRLHDIPLWVGFVCTLMSSIHEMSLCMPLFAKAQAQHDVHRPANAILVHGFCSVRCLSCMGHNAYLPQPLNILQRDLAQNISNVRMLVVGGRLCHHYDQIALAQDIDQECCAHAFPRCVSANGPSRLFLQTCECVEQFVSVLLVMPGSGSRCHA